MKHSRAYNWPTPVQEVKKETSEVKEEKVKIETPIPEEVKEIKKETKKVEKNATKKTTEKVEAKEA